MLASIHPLGERGRRNRWWLTAAAHVLGSAAGGALAGAGIGSLGRLMDHVVGRILGSAPVWGGALLLVCALAALIDATGRRVPWPVRRQVDERWLHRYRGWVYGAGFGFQLGLGLVTIVTTAAVLAVWFLAFLSASAGAGAAIGTAFGLGRAFPLLTTGGIDTPARLWSFQKRFQAGAPAARWMTVLVLGLSAAAGGLRLAGAL